MYKLCITMYEAEDDHDLVQDPFQLLLRSFLVSGTQLRVHVLGWVQKTCKDQ